MGNIFYICLTGLIEWHIYTPVEYPYMFNVLIKIYKTGLPDLIDYLYKRPDCSEISQITHFHLAKWVIFFRGTTVCDKTLQFLQNFPDVCEKEFFSGWECVSYIILHYILLHDSNALFQQNSSLFSIACSDLYVLYQ